jgi:hypothetical protein
MTSPRRRRKPSLVGRWYVAYYLARQTTWIKLALAVAGLSFLLALLRPFYSMLPPWLLWTSALVAIASVGFSVARSLRDFRAATLSPVTRSPREIEALLSQVAFPEVLRNAGYELFTGGLTKNVFDGERFRGMSACSPGLNRQLYSLDQPTFKVSLPFPSRTFLGRCRAWRLPTLARTILPAAVARLHTQGRTLENADKIRLCEDLLPPLALPRLTIERTDYVADVATGQVTGTRFVDLQGHDVYNGLDFAYDPRGDGWSLRLCRESACSNQLGTSCLVVAVSASGAIGSSSLDGAILVVQQGKGNVQSHGLLAPSGSGSLDWSDFVQAGESFVVSGMLRELLEETWRGSWEALVSREGISIVLTGYGRMLHRGGKPEFYGLVVMPRRRFERGIDPTERNFVRGFVEVLVPNLTATRMSEALDEFVVKNEAALSHPLYLSIRFAQQYLRVRPEHFTSLIRRAGTLGAGPKLQPPGPW